MRAGKEPAEDLMRRIVMACQEAGLVVHQRSTSLQHRDYGDFRVLRVDASPPDMMKEDAPIGVFNVSSGEGHFIRDVYDAVRGHLKLPPDLNVKVVPVGDDDVPSVVPDPSRTRSVLGWSARVSFAETMTRMLSWYDAHGVSDIYSHLAAAR